MTQFDVLDLLKKKWPKWMTNKQIAAELDRGRTSTATVMRSLRKFDMCAVKHIDARRMRYAYRHKPEGH